MAGKRKNGARAQIFAVDGGRMADPDIEEDRQANALVSSLHQVAFPLRRPVRIYRHARNGLAPVKQRSMHLFTRAPRDPGYDLLFIIQLEAVFFAALSGEDPNDDDANGRNMVRLAYVALILAAAAFCGSLLFKFLAGGNAAADAAQAAVRSLTGLL